MKRGQLFLAQASRRVRRNLQALRDNDDPLTNQLAEELVADYRFAVSCVVSADRRADANCG
jgi:hypothetical protein